MSDYCIFIIFSLLTLNIVVLGNYCLIKNYSYRYWLISPFPFFSFVWLIITILRPYFVLNNQRIFYGFFKYNSDSFIIADAVCFLMLVAFFVGAILFSGQLNYKKRPNRKNFINIYQAIQLRNFGFSLALLFQLLFLFFLICANAISIRIGQNRGAFLEYGVGRGWVQFVNSFSLSFAIIGFFYKKKAGSLGKFGWLFSLVFLFNNLIVSNRGVIAELLICIFVFRIKDKPIRFWKLVVVALSIGVLTSFIGLSRGLDKGAAISIELIVRFFTATFDMFDFLQIVISKNLKCDMGLSWLEDIFYTYAPRVFFPSKPTIYGIVRLQTEYLPSLTPVNGIFKATFPIGMMGESVANFGFLGGIIFFFIFAYIITLFFQRAIFLFNQGSIGNGLFYIVFYLQAIINPLMYIRSIGQFFAAMFFCLILSSGICFIMRERFGRGNY